MDYTLIKQELIKKLDELPVHKISSGGIQHTIRCPYCGDSKNPSHGHLSVKIDLSEPLSPIVFRCFKCNTSGILTPQVLEDLGLTIDTKLTDNLRNFNRKSAKYNKLTDTKIEDFNIPTYEYNKTVAAKLDYINGRLGTCITEKDANDLRMVLDIIPFLAINNIDSLDMCSKKQIWFYEHNYTGFLSYNRNVITLRAINDYADKRYVKVVLNPKNMDPNSYYTIPSSIDLLYTNQINIHIAEGIFDILGIYYNLMNRNRDNNFYYAICGFGYTSILRNIIRVGLNTGLRVHIYADNDKTDNDIIIPLKKSELWEWTDEIILHRNSYEGMKDYGVAKEYIRDTTRKIK